jgi:hypothetical protein
MMILLTLFLGSFFSAARANKLVSTWFLSSSHPHQPTMADTDPARHPNPKARPSSPTPAVQQPERFPLVYVSYHIWVPNGAPAMAPNVQHVEVASDDAVAASLPPFEVPFLAMSAQEFKRAVMAALGVSRSDFPLTEVLTAADAARKLQWRGNISWPGGPPTGNFNVSQSYKLFGEHAAQAVLPKRCRLQLIMENPLRVRLRCIGDPLYVSIFCLCFIWHCYLTCVIPVDDEASTLGVRGLRVVQAQRRTVTPAGTVFCS